MSQKENKKKYLEEYRVTLRIFESVFYKSLIRACSLRFQVQLQSEAIKIDLLF